MSQVFERQETPAAPTVLITGAAGNLGGKLRLHLAPRYRLRLLDRAPGGDPAIEAADLSVWNETWVRRFEGVETVVHLAANPAAQAPWEDLLAPNIVAMSHVFEAAARAGVRRVVYASSNHVMGGYKDNWRPGRLTTDLPPRPGARYVVEGEHRDSTPYGCTKLLGERIGQAFAARGRLSVIAVRIGWVRPGSNRADELPPERDDWFKLMWLSNRDFCLQLFERCVEADPALRFAVVNGMSDNAGMPWDLGYTRRLLGYEPQDGLGR